MKKTKLLLVASVIVAVIAVSCNKNQKVVNQLEGGTWKVASIVENGKALPDSTYKNDTYVFEKCKVKKGACDGTATEDGKSIPFTYEITEKGEKIKITMFNITSTSDILEHSKTKFVMKTTDGNDVTETTLTK